MSSHGGKREGAGRPKGSKNKGLSEEFLSLVPSAEKVITDALKLGDLKAAVYVIDQVYGKAKQRTEITGKDGEDLNPIGSVIVFGESAAPLTVQDEAENPDYIEGNDVPPGTSLDEVE